MHVAFRKPFRNSSCTGVLYTMKAVDTIFQHFACLARVCTAAETIIVARVARTRVRRRACNLVCFEIARECFGGGTQHGSLQLPTSLPSVSPAVVHFDPSLSVSLSVVIFVSVWFSSTLMFPRRNLFFNAGAERAGRFCG